MKCCRHLGNIPKKKSHRTFPNCNWNTAHTQHLYIMHIGIQLLLFPVIPYVAQNMCWPKNGARRRITTLWRVTSNIENKLNHLSGNAVEGKYLDEVGGGGVGVGWITEGVPLQGTNDWMGVTSPGRQIHGILLLVVKVTYLLQCYWIRICGLSNPAKQRRRRDGPTLAHVLNYKVALVPWIFSIQHTSIHFKMTDLDISDDFY